MSVCIPAYQGAGFLQAAMDSVLSQSFPDFELVVVDDASTDGTHELAARYGDPRVRVLHNRQRLGAAGNWNRCLSEARGRFVKLLPQDDVLAGDCLQRQVAVLQADAEGRLAFAFSARQVIDENGRSILRRGYPRSGSGVLDAAEITRRCLRRGTNLVGEPGAVLFRRALAARVGPFDARHPYVIDLDYWFRLLAWGDAYYDAEPLCAFRLQRQAWSVAIGRRQSSEFRAFMRHSAGWPRVAASRLDLLLGAAAAEANMRLRQLFYRFLLK